jgi:hypothetical protein
MGGKTIFLQAALSPLESCRLTADLLKRPDTT